MQTAIRIPYESSHISDTCEPNVGRTEELSYGGPLSVKITPCDAATARSLRCLGDTIHFLVTPGDALAAKR